MVEHIFRQYDIRGKIGTELNFEDITPIVKAIAAYFLSKKPETKQIAVGVDGRTHSPIIKELVCIALQESGLDVVFIGICPTPVLYFALHSLPVDGGLMITASHNGKEYNGLKICLGKESVWGHELQEIKKLAFQKIFPEKKTRGSYKEVPLIIDYIAFLTQHFSHLRNIEVPCVIDGGNGASGAVIPQLIKAMGWKGVLLLHQEIDGSFPNHEADPTVEKNMLDVKKMLKTGKFLFGAGLDGDCDRMACMTKDGELIQGDKLLAVFSENIIKNHPQATIVFDVKCSEGLIELLAKWGARPFMAPSGHSIIKNAMKEQSAVLAGELSCHFFFKDRYFGYDDGIYALLRLVECIIISKKSLNEMIAIFPQKVSTPEIRLMCKEEEKQHIVTNVQKGFLQNTQAKINLIDGIRVTFPYGWAILRASNTQPVICLRFEADTIDNLHRIKQDFVQLLEPYFDKNILKIEIIEA